MNCYQLRKSEFYTRMILGLTDIEIYMHKLFVLIKMNMRSLIIYTGYFNLSHIIGIYILINE